MDANVLELKLNQAAADAINRAGSLEEIKAAAVAEAERQNTATTTAAAEKTETDRKAAEQKAAEDAGKVYTQTETINGREFEFAANSPEDLQQQIINAYRVAGAVSEPVAPQPVIEQPKQKTAAEIEAERAELELKWKRGEITAKDYIAQSGAVTDYLASQGISVDALKNAVAQTQDTQYIHSWGEATQSFYAGAGKDWPASDRNMELMGMKLIELGLDEKPSVDALTQAYNALRKQNLLFPAEEVKNETTTVNATPANTTTTTAATTTAPAVQQTPAPARQNAAPVNTGRSSSGLFGMSTGVPANTVEKTEQPAKPLDIPATASPAEIMEAWKVEQQKQGIDPNAAFVSTFGRR